MEQLDNVIGRTATAIETALQEHGNEALELALVLYRIEGFKVIAVGFLGLLLFIPLVLGFFKIRRMIDPDFDDRAFSSFITSVILTLPAIFCLAAASKLFEFYHWAAVLGHPELLIAYKALVAVGVM